MGKSLIGGLIANGHPSGLICGADPDAAQLDQIKDLFGIEAYQTNADAINGADVVVLAVKPQAMQETIMPIANALQQQKPLIISIAAGIRLVSIANWLQQELPVVRVMPNTPALIQAGAAALYANDAVSNEQQELAETILRSVGIAIWIEDESLMDTVTAVSGSGPAYFFLLIEILEKLAIEMGLSTSQARLLTLETACGAIKMLMESDLDAETLRRQVTSPGGTTEAAMKVLTENKLEQIFRTALIAARKRSVDLAETFGDKT